MAAPTAPSPPASVPDADAPGSAPVAGPFFVPPATSGSSAPTAPPWGVGPPPGPPPGYGAPGYGAPGYGGPPFSPQFPPQYPGPPPAPRRRTGLFVGLGLAIGAVLLLLIGAGLLLVGAGVDQVLTHDLIDARFEQTAAPFHEDQARDYSWELVDGTYRGSVTREDPSAAAQSYGEFARVAYAFDLSATVVAVESTSSEPVVAGLGCVVTGSGGAFTDAYSMGVRGNEVAIVSQNSDTPLATAIAPHELRAGTRLGFTCRMASLGGSELSLEASVDGATVATASHNPGHEVGFTGMTLVMMGTNVGDNVRFDDVTAHVPGG